MYYTVDAPECEFHVMHLSLSHSMMPLVFKCLLIITYISIPLYNYATNKTKKQSTKLGVLMSFISLTIMVVLFFCETFDFLFQSNKISSYVDIDNKNYDQLLRVNFNVTLYDVQCEFVEVGTL